MTIKNHIIGLHYFSRSSRNVLFTAGIQEEILDLHQLDNLPFFKDINEKSKLQAEKS